MAKEQAKKLFARIRGDIYEYCKVQKFYPTHQQRQLFDAVQAAVDELTRKVEPRLKRAEKLRAAGRISEAEDAEAKATAVTETITRRIAVKSGQGPGKTTAGAILTSWWLLRWQGARVILTAPTMRQCKDVFVAEFERVLERGHPQIRKWFDVQNTQIGLFGRGPDIWGLLSITASKSENAQGQHGCYMMVLGEEASGISRDMIEQFKGTLSNPLGLLVLIGNPNTRDCAFFDCFHSQADRWNTYTWNAEETPASPWFNPARNKELEEEFGRESDVYRIRVRGEFPLADPGCLLSDEDVLACMQKDMKLKTMKASNCRRISIDFARYGGDKNTVMRRRGNAVVEMWRKERVDPSVAIATGARMQAEAGWSNEEAEYVCDATGIGQGAVSRLQGRRVHEFVFNAAAYNSRFYINKITEAWFQLAKLVRKKLIYIPYDIQLLKQLSSRKYMVCETDKRGRLMIEKKKDYKDRTGLPSPDEADTLVMLFYEQALPKVSA